VEKITKVYALGRRAVNTKAYVLDKAAPIAGAPAQEKLMSMPSQPSRKTPGRTILMAGVASVAILAAAATGFAVATPSVAASVPALSQTFQAPPSFANVIQQVTPAVVSVKVVTKVMPQNMQYDGNGDSSGQGADPFSQMFRQFRGGEQRQNQQPEVMRAEGSGFFVTEDGYIVTNNHVVKNATQVNVVTSDGRSLSAKIVGTDPQSDLAVLKVEGTGFSFVRFAGEPPRGGDWVVALGNPVGLGETATAGIVSAHGRDIGEGPYDNFLQIDAPVNRGNSGGPTFDVNGEVVGVNTAIYSPSGGSVGIGFAIPADTVQSVFTALKDKGHVTRGALGVQIQPVSQGIADALGLKEVHGALVDQLQPDSAAGKAGIASGDVITAVNGTPVIDAHDLARRISIMQPGAKVSISFVHQGESKTVDVALGTLPGAKADQQTGMNSPENDGLPRLGLTLAPSTDMPDASAKGVVVTNVDPSGAASDSGIKAGDVILDVNGQHVTTPAQVRDELRSAKSDHKAMALMRVQSGDQTHFVAVPVA
jgi:serine protease Do